MVAGTTSKERLVSFRSDATMSAVNTASSYAAPTIYSFPFTCASSDADNFTSLFQNSGASVNVAQQISELLCSKFDLIGLQFQWTNLAIDASYLLFSAYLVFAMQVIFLLP